LKILVTGTAGFIGFHLVKALADKGFDIVGLDNMSDYYDVGLKFGRLSASGISEEDVQYNRAARSGKYPNYRFIKLDLTDKDALFNLFERERFEYVCNLAAQPGVRYSIQNPYAYIDSNITGFMNILEACRRHIVTHLVFASSSSVYGLNEKMPFGTGDKVDQPASLYGATKKSNELMAHAYSYLYRIPSTGLRFFTVYGPWGRPDMAPFLFAKAIIEGKPIDVFNKGDMLRDFTYVSDIIKGVVIVIQKPPPDITEVSSGAAAPKPPYKIYNIGNSAPVNLLDFIKSLEQAIGKKANKNFLDMQPGDIRATYADIADLVSDTGYAPSTQIDQGIREFVDWYRDYYKI
jgi:UDP-glucuronate 4-epimerase